MSRLKDLYQEKVIPEFMKAGCKNKMAVPKVNKVIVNVGIGKNQKVPQFKEKVMASLKAITGQAPVVCRAKKAIAGFKVRAGDEVGLKVTLRGAKMADFLDKLANVTLPRIRDFRGLDPDDFDNHGNFSLGIREQIVFPEISHEAGDLHGLQIVIKTSTESKDEAQKLLKALGFPFKKKETHG